MRSTALLLFLLLMMFAPNDELSGSLVITSNIGTTHNADGYSTFTTTSSQMVGLRVTMFFGDGSSDSGLWSTTGISQSGWTMTQTGGSTFSNPFDVQNNTGKSISSFTMHGDQSSTIFDRGVNPSTDGTANGRDLQEYTFLRLSQDINVTYFDAVQTVGSTPVGDVFAGIDVAFSAGIDDGGQFRFRTDTDNTVNFVQPSTVPEPSTVLTFSILLLAIHSKRRRR